ncbi:MAG: SUMF1/EgtB/PvdO family nonheme iron enzyme [Myxococcota bacterium]
MAIRNLWLGLALVAACAPSDALFGPADDPPPAPASVGATSSSATTVTGGGASLSGVGGHGAGAGGAGGGGGVTSEVRPSCVGLPPTCGANATDDCCDARPVPAATFDHLGATLSVSGFRLDRFEVTVGRFRRFVAAVVDDGWRPFPGSGRHEHVSPVGLVDDLETGWDPQWDASLPADAAGWDAMLGCEEFGPGASTYAQWSPTPEGRETRPIGCMTWVAAYAFCIFDGGFLPTEAEWSLAATGGQPSAHPYPWGVAAPSPARAAYDCASDGCDRDSVAPVGTHPTGAGPFGHDDLAGNVWEWTRDRFSSPFAKSNCVDCVVLQSGGSTYSARGGGFIGPAADMATATRATFSLPRGSGIGLRCAQSP